MLIPELPQDQLVEATVTATSGLRATIALELCRAARALAVARRRSGWCALGIEPCDTPSALGRADARARGILRLLEPGESVNPHP